MGIQSTIEESTAVFIPSMKRVADIVGTSIFAGIGALILTAMNSILTLLDMPESVRQTRGPSGALEDADLCA